MESSEKSANAFAFFGAFFLFLKKLPLNEAFNNVRGKERKKHSIRLSNVLGYSDLVLLSLAARSALESFSNHFLRQRPLALIFDCF